MQCSLSESGPEFTEYQVTLKSVVTAILEVRGTSKVLHPELRLKGIGTAEIKCSYYLLIPMLMESHVLGVLPFKYCYK